MKRLLYIAHRVPFPPDKGERVRAFHEIVQLAGRFDVTLAALSHGPDDAANAARMGRWCRKVLHGPAGGTLGLLRGGLSLLAGRSVTEGYFRSPSLEAQLAAEARREPFDVVFAYCSSVLPLALHIPAGAYAIDLVDVDSAKWAAYAAQKRWPGRAIFRREARAVARLERRALEGCQAVFVVSEQEAALIPPPRPNVLPVVNGVDSEFFSPDADLPAPPVEPAGPMLAFVGQMDYPPNEDAVAWFVADIWPQLRAQHPTLEFYIVGRDPTARVLALMDSPGVTVTGTVPDVRPYLAAAVAVVAPLRIARGIQNKVLEAMAMGRAVVASPQALEGIEAEPGTHALVADCPAGWVEAVSAVLREGPRREGLGQAARRLVTEKYVWSARLAPLVAECERLAATPRAGRPAGAPARPSRGLRMLTGLYAAALAAGSLLPTGRIEALKAWDDAMTPSLQNALHVPAYALLWLLAAACAGGGRVGGRRAAALAGGCLAFGALMEVLQAMIPSRTGSILDMLLNAAGVAAGWAGAAWWARRAGRYAARATG